MTTDSPSIADRIIDSGFSLFRFSQLGEDSVVLHYFGTKRNGFYVDIGAHHPFRYSNTAMLHEVLGWRGINVDPDERAISAFRQYRPNDINLTCAIAGEEKQVDFYEFNDGAVNTIDTARALVAQQTFGQVGTRSVVAMTLKSVFDNCLPKGQSIDYLNIDTEGLDIEVLASNDWDLYRPTLVSVEDHGFDISKPVESPCYVLLKEKGYQLFSHCVVTSFYVRKD